MALGYRFGMTVTLLARADLHGLALCLWCEDGLRWYVECLDQATDEIYRHVEVRGTNEAGMALYARLMEKMSDTAEHPARPDGEWWPVDEAEPFPCEDEQ